MMHSIFPGLTGYQRRLRLAVNLAIFVSLSLIIAWSSVCLAADDDKVTEVRLVFVEQVHARGSVYIETLESKVEFKKEPDYAGRDIVRGAMRCGAGPGNIVGYAFNKTSGKLYLDSNVNQDLTDDKVHNVERLFRDYFEDYEGLELRVPRGELEVPYSMSFSYNSSYTQMSITSGWQGTVELDGKTWKLSIVDNLNGLLDQNDRLVIAPAETDKKGKGSYSLDFVDMAFPERLFFQGTNYELSAEFVAGEDDAELLLKLREVDSPTAVIDVEGENIRWLLLEGSQSVVLASPSGQVVAPAANYDAFYQSVILAGDSGEFYKASGNTDLSLKSGETSSFKMGGPLNNSVNVTRSGSGLTLDYALVGIGGETYEALGCDDDETLFMTVVNNPGFAIYKDGEELASGNFEYG